MAAVVSSSFLLSSTTLACSFSISPSPFTHLNPSRAHYRKKGMFEYFPGHFIRPKTFTSNGNFCFFLKRSPIPCKKIENKTKPLHHLSRSARLSSWLFWTVASSTAISPLSSSVCFSSSPTLRWLPCHSLFNVATFSFRAVTCTLILASASSPRFACSSLAFFSDDCERKRFNLLSF